MSNITIENVDIGSVILQNAEFRDDTLQFSAPGTIPEGTILARQTVVDPLIVTPDGGNTGDGTVTNAVLATGPIVPIPGNHLLTCVETVANGGVFNLTDPNGALIGSQLTMTVGAGATTSFEVAGFAFDITDGTTDFVAGDFFTIVAAPDLGLTPFAVDGVGGAQIPVAILTYDVVRTAAGPGKEPVRAGVSGSYRKERLIIAADGDDSNVNATVIDQLRDFGLVPIDVQELNILDNQ